MLRISLAIHLVDEEKNIHSLFLRRTKESFQGILTAKDTFLRIEIGIVDL